MLKIRLRRMGSRHRPFFRVVVSDGRNAPTAAALDEIGFYDPRKKPSLIQIDAERIEYWQGRGAQLSSTVRRLVRDAARPVPVAEAETRPAEKPAEKKPAEKKPAEEPAAEAEAEKAEAKPEKAEAEPEKEKAEETEAKAAEAEDAAEAAEAPAEEAEEAEKAEEKE